ncbi:MAG: ribosomal protein chloroplastic-like, partial [Candidatus Saccharibacteria bacterium]|nr:ribosomal protein chloroplastic-like [Candidatus Saccharibacteria bacterium]
QIETTLPKAKELTRYIEKLITKAKKGDLANRRRVIAGLSTQAAAFKLVDEIAPQLTGRTSGHVRVKRTRLRIGDGAQMATIGFVDELKAVEKPATAPVKKAAAPKAKQLAEAKA